MLAAMEQLLHFSHEHLLKLVHLQSTQNTESSDEEEKDEHEDEDFVAEENHVGQCNMCKEQIYLFHLYYYTCKDCDYSLHKFCAEMPKTLQNHPLHPSHNLTLAEGYQLTDPVFQAGGEWMCGVCNLKWKKIFSYHCAICEFNMDIICATMSQQKKDHSSHPHQLQRMLKQLVSHCSACGFEHKVIFYYCITCFGFWINLECALMPSKLLIQQPTNGTLMHRHPLTLTYSFPHTERRAKFYPDCRVCDKTFSIYYWFYKCDRCRYYIHIGCATSNYIHLLRPGRGKTYKNFKDDDHPNLIHCPFPDESYNLIKHLYFNQDFIDKENHGERLNHFGHQHPLILLDTQISLSKKSIFLHNPMKRIQLLCDGCVNPITDLPFYKCYQDTPNCSFVLHEWCARLPLEIQDHPGHRKHTLVLQTNLPRRIILYCDICWLPTNGFVYGCSKCNYYVDINCANLPEVITHEAHPSHLLSIPNAAQLLKVCNACQFYIGQAIAYHCPSCDFYLHANCALLFPRMIRNKYDKHALRLKYNPVENHPGDYFCVICEDEVSPLRWFYHCTVCLESMHPACAPLILILGCEQATYTRFKRHVFDYVNVKFGGTFEISGHPHLLAFVQGIKRHGRCKKCDQELQYEMIFKCLECEHALHYNCVPSLTV